MPDPHPPHPLYASPSREGAELFDEFFDSGLEESVSPFLTQNSRGWGRQLGLKSSLLAALFLLCSFTASFFPQGKILSSLTLLLTYFFAGIPALIASVEDLFNLQININVLMTLAAFLSVLIGSGTEGALLLVLFSLSGAIEQSVQTRAKGTLNALKKLAPQKACVVQEDGTLLDISVKDIRVGTPIHVRAGEMIPLDGKVVEGISSVNLVHLTGENLPVTRTIGDTVPAGGWNLEGALTLEVTHNSAESTLSRIIRLVTQAQETKPKLQRWLDKVSDRYAMTIIGLSCLFALSLPWFLPIPYLGVEGSLYRALAFLIAASPCALILAIPIAYLSAISNCARQGILLKGGAILDTVSRCNAVAMDKTGTLTTGALTCLEMIVPEAPLPFLAIAYALERSAVHPIARAITAYATERGVSPAAITHFRSHPGHGLEALYQGERVRIGHADWLRPTDPALLAKIQNIQAGGEIVALLAVGEHYALFRFRDLLRPYVRTAMRTLKEKWKLRLIMLTGDHEASARAIAAEAGITEYHANLTPEEKLRYISQEERLMMIGDGINDAPALARATVGIAMGKVGSGAAVSASDIVFLQDNIELVPWLIGKAHHVVRVVTQNITVAAAAILCATTPALLGWIPLWLAVVIHEGGTVLVGLNALRLLRTEAP